MGAALADSPRRGAGGLVETVSLGRIALELTDVETPHVQWSSMRVAHGECVALSGPNGSGKTTLLRTAAGLVQIRRGRRFAERPIGYVPQDWRASFLPWLSARDNALLGARGIGREEWSMNDDLDSLLDEIGLEPSAVERMPRDLSGGQLQLLAIVRAILVRPRLLLLDEALSAVDSIRRPIALGLIDRARRADCGVLFATHDRRDVETLADRVVSLEARQPAFAHGRRSREQAR